MRKVNDVINRVLVLANDIKTTGSANELEKKILSYIKQDSVPYTGMLNKDKKILKDLETIDSNFANAFREYLKKYPIIIGDSSPGSHVDISQASLNNGFVFMLGLVVTVLATDFNSWYTPDLITYLTHLNKQGELLRCVFSDDESNPVKIFTKQFDSIYSISDALSRGVTFICKEPGLGQNHFIFGVLIENKLIFVNPIGETAHKDFYEIVSSIKKDYGLEIYLSNTILQKDLGLTAKGMASCGPICVELIRHISSLPKEKILSLLSSLTKAATKTENELEYQEISVEVLLPESLRALSTVDLANYRSSVEELRKQHLDILTNDPLIASLSLKEQNEFLEKNCLNHPVQVAIKLMCQHFSGQLTKQFFVFFHNPQANNNY